MGTPIDKASLLFDLRERIGRHCGLLIDLCRTQVPIALGVRFNLGDCLKILVYHDALHLSQALHVLVATPQLVPDQAGQLDPPGLSARGGPAGGREL